MWHDYEFFLQVLTVSLTFYIWWHWIYTEICVCSFILVLDHTLQPPHKWNHCLGCPPFFIKYLLFFFIGEISTRRIPYDTSSSVLPQWPLYPCSTRRIPYDASSSVLPQWPLYPCSTRRIPYDAASSVLPQWPLYPCSTRRIPYDAASSVLPQWPLYPCSTRRIPYDAASSVLPQWPLYPCSTRRIPYDTASSVLPQCLLYHCSDIVRVIMDSYRQLHPLVMMQIACEGSAISPVTWHKYPPMMCY